ncbi:nucleotidyltransferase family protein [Alicyclobacillus curvatus]|nr:nucleotidyltransferase family protein [Alicyclobacillus curvatus]
MAIGEGDWWNVLTQLIENLYLGNEVDLGSHPSFEHILSDIRESSILPQVLRLLHDSGQLHAIPSHLRNELMMRREQFVGQSLFIRRIQEEICNTLEDTKTPVIPLKGIYFAERFFGHFAARPTSDIDLLVRDTDVSEVIRCLRALGFHGPSRFNPVHFHCVMWKPIEGAQPTLNVEVHWSLMHRHSSSLDMEALWAGASPKESYQYVYELSVLHTFYAICLHGANHAMESFKYSLDVAHLLYRFGRQIDLPVLLTQAKRDKTYTRVRTVLAKVYQQFPSLHRIKPLPRTMTRIWLSHDLALQHPLLLLDSFGQRAQFVKSIIWPDKEVVLWFMRDDPKISRRNAYLRFYQRRTLKLFRRIAAQDKGGHTVVGIVHEDR